MPKKVGAWNKLLESVNKEINMLFLFKVLAAQAVICRVTVNSTRTNCQITNSGFEEKLSGPSRQTGLLQMRIARD